MIKGYENLPHDACTDHLIESDIAEYTEDPAVKSVLSKSRAVVGYFNSSTIGKADLGKEQESVGLPAASLTQDVVTRWRSTHDMCESMRVNMQPLLIYDVKNTVEHAESF